MSKEAAKLIRQELKTAFPQVKFSVISDHNSVRVSYSDGPTTDDVEAIIGKYQYGHFNGMDDIYEYTNKQDFAQAKYVFIDREWTMETKQYAFRMLGIAQENELDWRGVIVATIASMRVDGFQKLHSPLQGLSSISLRFR